MFKLPIAASLACVTALPLWAEGERPVKFTSPFAFAASMAKAERLKTLEGQLSGARVIGGEVAADGAWPWQVALMVAGHPASPDSHFCGGSMLLDQWVLTAAHCIHMQDDTGVFRDLEPGQFEVFLGDNRLEPGQGDMVPIEAVFRHPSYVGTSFDHDIALLKLARPPEAAYQTITVPDAAFGDLLDQPGVPTTVTGWGLIEGAEHTAAMHEARIQMLSRDDCNTLMLQAQAEEASEGFRYAVDTFGLTDEDAQAVWDNLIGRVRMPLSENMLCAGTFEGGKTSCQGDSGGPLVVPLDDGSYIQAGVVSWGLSAGPEKTCAENALFSAYTRVSNYLPWLQDTIDAN